MELKFEKGKIVGSTVVETKTAEAVKVTVPEEPKTLEATKAVVAAETSKAAIPVETSKKVKTMGKFVIKSNFDPTFSYEGYSRQAEIMFKDYMGWCAKNKAPKALQTHYDKIVKENKNITTPIFVLRITPLTEAEFALVAKKSPAKKSDIPIGFVMPTLGEIATNNK
jgi:hypothetical protein